ncbi:hypothetical protein [Streptomyces sp. NPDC029526]|uniref:hypothetical protein n=1 Tax=Streptomyces sp. NPDC029526 TaxID=3155728 RepID=UPI0033FC6026
MLSTVDQAARVVALPAPRTRSSRTAAARTGSARPRGSAGAPGSDVLRIVSDPRTPTYVSVHANGRRRYSYWRPIDSTTGLGGCYVALPTEECDALHAAGRITLGDPVVDPHRTTYRVRAAVRTPATATRPADRSAVPPQILVRRRARVA